ncbi:hypothetical protein GCM10027168_08590 [Streptomyces capparidis]
MLTLEPVVPVLDIWASEPEWRVPSLASRYEYKKKDGSSDTNNEYDTMEV